MKKTFLIISFFVFVVCALALEAFSMENVTYANLTNDLREEVIIEKTISTGKGVTETIVNIYKHANGDDLRLIWSGI